MSRFKKTGTKLSHKNYLKLYKFIKKHGLVRVLNGVACVMYESGVRDDDPAVHHVNDSLIEILETEAEKQFKWEKKSKEEWERDHG